MDGNEDVQPLCSLEGMSGLSKCKAGTYCGSNYDLSGNPRFSDGRVLHSDVFDATRDWGFNQYQNVGAAFLSVFQV
jgi:hypothetical protein